MRHLTQTLSLLHEVGVHVFDCEVGHGDGR